MNETVTPRGTATLPTEFIKADAAGFDIRIDGRDFRINFVDAPWFKYCTVDEMADFKADQWGVYWGLAEVDLCIESLEHPEKFPCKISVESWMRIRTRKAAAVLGRVSTPRKAAASRSNGAAGGRPRKKSMKKVLA